MRRTHRCGEISGELLGQDVRLQGWLWHERDFGGVKFLDIRDRAGFVQCVIDPTAAPGAHAASTEWGAEFVVEIEGTVIAREERNVNPDLPNGDVEVQVHTARLLSRSETPPFVIEDEPRTSEETRLRERFLDLRRAPLQRSLALRHRLSMATRNVLDAAGFYEIETPMLTRSTPEGARDYLVPSREAPGSFYALPQSPQLFKQLLMISGFDRYFQIVRCFRDEDLRADRQPEFTQIDIEMSFAEIQDVRALTEDLMRALLEAAGHDPDVEFGEMSFREAVDRFGSDRPDLRYGRELLDVSGVFGGSGFKAFAGVVASGGVVKALRVPGGGAWGRSRFDKLTDVARDAGAKGLVWMKFSEGEIASPIAKFLDAETIDELKSQTKLEEGDALLIVGDQWEPACMAVGGLRTHLARSEEWAADGMRFVWITEFPLLEENVEAGRMVARHHPFTSPMVEDLDKLETEPLAVRAQAYDLVLNGIELGGGSIRIHESEVQSRVFSALGIDVEEAGEKFGFLLRALSFGAPPHGGIALGFDRIVMMLAGLDSLRDVIAFPKTTSASDLMTNAPGGVSAAQLQELGIEVVAREDGE
ncbi:MAG: aspartate--tRNA ligase [Acidobacteria bacterium]|nr:aspartate--tRNA ligase [Acidobacteriota bacterium]